MFCLSLADEYLPAWFPPSPPASESDDDLYVDHTGDYFYERELMEESRLPKQIYELHRPRPLAPTSTTNEAAHLPVVTASLDAPVLASEMPLIIAAPPSPTGMCTLASGIVRDVLSSPVAASPAAVSAVSNGRGVNLAQRAVSSATTANLEPSNVLLSSSSKTEEHSDAGRKSMPKPSHGMKQQISTRTSLVNARNGKDMKRPLSPPPKRHEASDYDGPDWSVAEDHSLLYMITKLQQVPGHLHSSKNAQVVGWEFVSHYLDLFTYVYRSPRQSSVHYQMVVQPREEGRMITLDPVTKKTRKVPLTTAEMIHMKRGRTKTDQQYYADAHKLFNQQFVQKMKTGKNASIKQLAPYKRVVAESTLSATSGSPSSSQEAKLTESKCSYEDVKPLNESMQARYKRALEMKEQEKEMQTRKKDEVKVKECKEIEGRREKEKKLFKNERLVSTMLGVISSQLPSLASILDSATATTTSVSSSSSAAIRSYVPGGHVQGPATTGTSTVQGSNCAGEVGQVLVGQRAYLEHPQAIISSSPQGSHQISTRRVAIPVASGAGTQHQIVMAAGTPIATGSGQQPFAVVVTSQDNLSTGQAVSGRFQYATRQEGGNERPAVYRTISASPSKRPMPSVQRLSAGYAPITEAQQQIYGGRTLIMPQSDASSSDPTHLQMVRPQLQAASGNPLRQQKLGQRAAPSRVFLTTSTGGERTFIMPQQQVRMLAGNQRIATKRSAGSVHPKAIPGQSQVTMMVPARGGNLQQIRTIRNISYSGAVRVPPVGFIMGGSTARTAEAVSGSGTPRQLYSGVPSRQTITTIPPAGTPRQVTIAVQGTGSHMEGSSGVTIMRESAPSALQDHPSSMTQQHPQYLPPITLSNQPTLQQRYVSSSVAPTNMTTLQTGEPNQSLNPQT